MLSDGLSCAKVGHWLLMDGDTVRGHREHYLLSVTVCPSVVGVVEWVAWEFGVRHTPSGMASPLGRMGHAHKRPVKVPGKADPQDQREFVQKYERTKTFLWEHDRTYFLDGVHPLHNSMMVKGWVKRGRIVHLTTNTGRSRVNINGALQVATGRVVAV